MATFDPAHASIRNGSDLLRPEQINQLATAQALEFRDGTLAPGRTLQLFARQIAHGNIACSAVRHLAGEDFSDSAW